MRMELGEERKRGKDERAYTICCVPAEFGNEKRTIDFGPLHTQSFPLKKFTGFKCLR